MTKQHIVTLHGYTSKAGASRDSQLLMTPRFQLTPDGEESSDNQNALYDSLSMMRHPTTPTTLLLFEITQLQVQKKKNVISKIRHPDCLL